MSTRITRWLRWSIPGLLGSTLVTAALAAFPVAGCAGDQHYSGAILRDNHDINDPHAVSFAGEFMPVANVSPEEFQFGYDQAIYRDSNSLSYVAEPVKDVWIFGIDSCNYADNPVTGHPGTSGRLSDETLSWIVEKLEEAKRREKVVAGFTYPSPSRLVDLHGCDAAAVRARYVEEIDYGTGGKTFPEYAEEFLPNVL